MGHLTSRTDLLFVVLCVGASLSAGCPRTDINPPPDVVFAVFDPAGTPPQIPLPNDITMIPAKPTTPAAATFSQPLDPATLRPDTVLAIDLDSATPIIGIGLSFDTATNRLVIMPPGTGWPLGRVAIVVRGGETGVRGAEGERVEATPAFFFVRSTVPISNCTMPAEGCTSATSVLTVEQAIGLERLRQAFAPLFAGLEAQGIPRQDVVLAWTFTVVSGT